jgi:hypothetical protein
MLEIMASLAPVSAEDEGALVQGRVLVLVEARVREGRQRESPLSQPLGDDLARSFSISRCLF